MWRLKLTITEIFLRYIDPDPQLFRLLAPMEPLGYKRHGPDRQGHVSMSDMAFCTFPCANSKLC